MAIGANAGEQWFDLPSDEPADLAAMPARHAKDLAARVGSGGVTRREFEDAVRGYMNLRGMEAAPEGGYASVKLKTTPRDESNALYNAIDEELLFQAAVAEGMLGTPDMESRIRQELYGDISAMPELPRPKGDGAIRFVSTRKPDLDEFTEERIEGYYKAHPEQFKAPIRVKVKSMEWPREADEGGLTTRKFEAARNDPAAETEWQEGGWVSEGTHPSEVHDGMEPSELAKLFATPKGDVTPILNGHVSMYVFWVVDREDTDHPLPLAEVRPRVLYRLAQARFMALNPILNSEPDRFLRMAIQKGSHRNLRLELGSRYMNAHREKTRDQLLEELRRKFKVEILMKDPAFAKDQRAETRAEMRSDEEKAMMSLMRRPGMPSRNPAESPPHVPAASWRDWLSWLVWPVIFIAGIFAVWKYRSS